MEGENDIVEDGGADSTPPKKTPDPVPYSRFREVVQQRRDLETKLATAEAALSAAETAKLAVQTKLDDAESIAKAQRDELESKLATQDAAMQKYKDTLSSITNEAIKDWPEEVKIFDPGEDADPAVRAEWSEKAKLLVAKLGGSQPSAGMGQKPLPKPSATEARTVSPEIDVKRSF
jgi:hypothetical protein